MNTDIECDSPVKLPVLLRASASMGVNPRIRPMSAQLLFQMEEPAAD